MNKCSLCLQPILPNRQSLALTQFPCRSCEQELPSHLRHFAVLPVSSETKTVDELRIAAMPKPKQLPLSMDELNFLYASPDYIGKGQILGLLYAGMKLAEEAGEVNGELTRLLRDDRGKLTLARAAKIRLELGDVLMNIIRIHNELGTMLKDDSFKDLVRLIEDHQAKLAAKDAAKAKAGEK